MSLIFYFYEHFVFKITHMMNDIVSLVNLLYLVMGIQASINT